MEKREWWGKTPQMGDYIKGGIKNNYNYFYLSHMGSISQFFRTSVLKITHFNNIINLFYNCCLYFIFYPISYYNCVVLFTSAGEKLVT